MPWKLWDGREGRGKEERDRHNTEGGTDYIGELKNQVNHVVYLIRDLEEHTEDV